MRVARQVVVLADSTKWGVVSLSSYARLSEVDVLVTDELLPAEARAAVSKQVGEIIYAENVPDGEAHRQAG
jgi:DeoR/GlpR family transcriptional regulator of sugar metabolism